MFHTGQKIGLYTLVQKLGRGGFGEVWLAEKRSQFVTKRVAVKLPHDDQVNFDAISQEATLWEQASGHPNVLPIIDADVYDDQVVIVSEYADGGSLADKLKRENKLSLKLAVEMTIGILNGLEFLHNRKIIHRDIKPQNILLQGNTPRLADFGISRAMQTTAISSTITGTDAYMAPEAFDGKRSAQTDIWSVGVVLYLLLKGSLPFPQEHPSERMFAVLTKEFDPLPAETPVDLRRIVHKALAKQPDHRYKTAQEMSEELEKALIGIAHPTFANTEVLIRPDISSTPVNQTNDETIQTQHSGISIHTVAENNLTEATEITTIVSKSPAISQPTQQLPQQSGNQQQDSNAPVSTQPAYYSPASPPSTPALKPEQNTPPENNPGGIVSAVETENDSLANYPRQSRISTTKNGEKSAIRKNPLLIILISIVIFVLLAIGLTPLFRSDSSSANNKSASNAATTPALTPTPTLTPKLYGLNTDLKQFEDGSKWGYKDKNGSIIIPAKYDDGDFFFHDGFAPVKLKGKWTYIDEKDNPLIPFKYDGARYFSDGIAFVKSGGKWGAIDRTGKEIFPFIYTDSAVFLNGLAKVNLNGKAGYIDSTGREVIPFKFTKADDFNWTGLTSACIGAAYKECAVIDKTGKEITPFKYDSILPFWGDLAIVSLNDKYGAIDKTGKEVIPLIYDTYIAGETGNDPVFTRSGRKYRVDKTGSETDISDVPTPIPANKR